MANKLVRSFARYVIIAGSAGLFAACSGADGTVLEEDPLWDTDAEELSGRGCKPSCPLPEKTIDCGATPSCEECCSGFACRSVPCCNPYVNTCKVINKRPISNNVTLPPTHGDIDSLPVLR